MFLIKAKIKMSHFEAKLLRISDPMFKNIMKIRKKAYKKIKKKLAK